MWAAGVKVVISRFVVSAILLVALTSVEADPLTSRPCVLLNRAELTRLRREIQTVAWKRNLYRCQKENPNGQIIGMRPSAEKWLTQTIQIPPRSGHMHHFYCECGTRLELPKDRRPHPETGYKCPACGKEYKGEKFDAAVRWWMHNDLAYGARNLALVYAIDGDKRFARKSAEILLKYAEAYPGPHTSLLEGGMMYQSLCEAVWGIMLAHAYDLIYDSGVLSEREKQKVECRLLKPIAQGLVAVRTHGNWESWHLSAIGVIGYAIGDKDLIEYAINRFKEQITQELGDDGLWPESVHGYHFYPLTAFTYLAEAAYHNGVDLYNWEARSGKGLRVMFSAPIQYMYPNMQLPAINDGWYRSFMPLDLYELAYARYGDSAFGWILMEGYRRGVGSRQGMWALLQGIPLKKDLEAPVLKSINFPVLGIAILRSPGGAMLTFDYGPYLGHGQRDKMGITLFANGKVCCADYGTPGYGSKIMEWFVSTPAHNTVVVDNKSQELTKQGRLTCFGKGQTLEVAEAETEEAYPGVLHIRSVIRVGENFIIIDTLKSQTEHTYDFFLRFDGKTVLDSDRAVTKPLGYRYVSEKSQFDASGNWSLRCESDGQGVLLFSLGSEPCLVTIGACPAETGSRTASLVIARKFGRETRFITVLCPYRKGRTVNCSMVDGLVKIVHDELVDWVFVGCGSSSSLLETDAQYALVRLKGSEKVLTELVGGTVVRWK